MKTYKTAWYPKKYAKHIQMVAEARGLYKQGYTITWVDFLKENTKSK